MQLLLRTAPLASMVWVFPEPVGPYARIVTLYPSSADCTHTHTQTGASKRHSHKASCGKPFTLEAGLQMSLAPVHYPRSPSQFQDHQEGTGNGGGGVVPPTGS